MGVTQADLYVLHGFGYRFARSSPRPVVVGFILVTWHGRSLQVLARAHAAGRVGSRLPDRAAACLLASRQA